MGGVVGGKDPREQEEDGEEEEEKERGIRRRHGRNESYSLS